MEFIRKLSEKYGPEFAKEKGKLPDTKEGEKGDKKRRKLPEGEAPEAPAVAPKQ